MAEALPIQNNKHCVDAADSASEDPTNTRRKLDEVFMRQALIQAELAISSGEVPVGCVFVRRRGGRDSTCNSAEGEGVISTGFNATNAEMDATRHAELVAADQILLGSGGRFRADVFKECDLYVTCEPCLMCAAALGHLGIRSVVFGCSNDKFGGCGSILELHKPLESHISASAPYPSSSSSSPRAAGGGCCYPVTAGVLKEEAVTLFKRFYSRANIRAPETKRKRKEDESGPVHP
mmetsp:Transcript_69593/g.136828  ORF Transcript_69593/g.136828 Transcript_69593/m.136828 type:complete len:236 (-) Transcript_69593:51-758(-)